VFTLGEMAERVFRCNTLQHTATHHRNTLQHTATHHRNTLQHTGRIAAQVFRDFDTDVSHSLDAHELQNVLRELATVRGSFVTETQVTQECTRSFFLSFSPFSLSLCLSLSFSLSLSLETQECTQLLSLFLSLVLSLSLSLSISLFL